MRDTNLEKSTSAPAPFRGRAELLAFLIEVSQAVSTHQRDLDELLHVISRLIRKVVDYEMLAVLLTVEGEDALRIRHAVGLPEDVVEKVTVRIGQGITGAAASGGETVLVNDVSKDSRYIRAIDSVRSEIAVPLVARGKTVGVLDLQSTHRNAFTDYERNMMELIASRVSAAVDNARLLETTVRQNLSLRTLLELSQEFSTILNMDQLMETIAMVTRRLIEYDAYSIFLLDSSQERLEHFTSFRYDKRAPLDSVTFDMGVVGAAARSRRPIVLGGAGGNPGQKATIKGVPSEIAVPMLLRDRLIGVLDLESNRSNFFNQEHASTLSMLASQLAAAIENARLHEQIARNEAQLKNDLNAARKLQRDLLLPECPEFEGVEIAAHNEPLREVSGDFYDFYPYPGSHVGLVVGDVSGKGAAAALYGGLVSGLLRSLVRFKQSPAALLEDTNQALAERQDDPSTYAAVVYVQWNPYKRELTMSNSGLPLPLVRRNGRVFTPQAAGIPLGMFKGTHYDELLLELGPGDLVILASDGVFESQLPGGEEYGQERLEAVIARSGDEPAAGVVERIFDDIRRHTSGAKPHDDQTLVVMKVKELSG